jgi:hypothetical protein
MTITYSGIKKWFDAYFATFNRDAGPLATVVNMKKFFTDDLEFWGYHLAEERPSNRETLLTSMVHPGLHEHLTPLEYAIDLKKMIVVVNFRVQFSDQNSGKVWPPKLTSTHYHLTLNERNELQIKKIIYFMEHRPPEESDYRPLWTSYREKEFAEHGKLAGKLK